MPMAIHSEHAGKPRALITGLRGFTGRYLAQELASEGYQVFGTAHGDELRGPEVFSVDLRQADQVRTLVERVQPDIVAHLAAISNVAYGNVDTIYGVNVVGTRNLLAALAALKHKPRKVLVASSANIYGNTEAQNINELEPAQPANDYAVSKLAMEYVCKIWMEQLPIVITRPFNYTGVGQAETFLLPKIVAHFRQRKPFIELGNLDVERDFSDVRTVVKIYAKLLSLAPGGEAYNISSGLGTSLREVIAQVEGLAGYKIQVAVNPAFVRKNEVKKLVGDSSKLASLIGHVATFPLQETLSWMLAASTEPVYS